MASSIILVPPFGYSQAIFIGVPSPLSVRHLVGGVIPSAAGVGGIMPIRITPSRFVQAVFLSSADLTKVNP